jgi:hypothetical protein
MTRRKAMDIYMIVFRLIHILAGVFWVGTALFFALFFEQTISTTGPAGGVVMGRLTLTRFPMVMAGSAILTIVAGILMYWSDSGGFNLHWIAGPSGLALTIGSLAGIAAFILGAVVQTPTTARIAALQKEILASGQPPTPAQQETLHALQVRMSQASRWGAMLMVMAVIGMALARELGS